MSVEAAQAIEFEFECKLSNGLHARPASHLAETANRFASTCELTNRRTQTRADTKSVLSIIAADVREGDICTLRVEGPDRAAAMTGLQRFILEELPACDEPLAEAALESNAPALPRGLADTGATYLYGIAVSRGIGRGTAVVLGRMSLNADFAGEPVNGPGPEGERVTRGFGAVKARIEEMLGRSPAAAEAAILNAHLAILSDVTLRDEISKRINAGRSAARAIVEASEHFRALLQRTGSAYIRERAIDVEELCTELLEEIYGSQFRPPSVELCEPSILVAETLAPHQLLALDRSCLEGIVLESAGATSHAVILARSMGIPAVVGVAGAARALAPGEQVIVDGDRGLVFPHSPAPVVRFYDRERAAAHRRKAALAKFAEAPAITLDGQRLEIGVNVSTAAEAVAGFANGADGIGLFRTELLFAERKTAPTEEEQFEVYAAAVRAGNGRPVILRTADIGGDKPLPYLNLPSERNPFLGYRGIRIYAEYREMIGAQIRAALRASAVGPVWLMAPMVASLEEALWFKGEVARGQNALRAQGAGFNPRMPVGIMIEVPAVAFQLKRLCADLDFFSVGTNDLSQYFYAADRENPKLVGLANVRGPAFLALLRNIVSEIRSHGKWAGLCGEMGGDPRNLPLLVGIGFDEISASGNVIPPLKRATARLNSETCRKLTERAVQCGTAAEVEALLDRIAPASFAEPLFSTSLVTLGSDSQSKDEAIRELIDTLHAAGRIEDRARMEEAVWAREAVYSTGLGHGFAIPHCKTDLVDADSIGILKLKQPIEWGSLDGAPVSMVILLALSDSNPKGSHMKVFSRLARKLMDEEFRGRLMEINDPGELISHVGRELEDSL